MKWKYNFWGVAKATLWGNILAMSACTTESQINLRNCQQPNNTLKEQNPKKCWAERIIKGQDNSFMKWWLKKTIQSFYRMKYWSFKKTSKIDKSLFKQTKSRREKN